MATTIETGDAHLGLMSRYRDAREDVVGRQAHKLKIGPALRSKRHKRQHAIDEWADNMPVEHNAAAARQEVGNRGPTFKKIDLVESGRGEKTACMQQVIFSEIDLAHDPHDASRDKAFQLQWRRAIVGLDVYDFAVHATREVPNSGTTPRTVWPWVGPSMLTILTGMS